MKTNNVLTYDVVDKGGVKIGFNYLPFNYTSNRMSRKAARNIKNYLNAMDKESSPHRIIATIITK